MTVIAYRNGIMAADTQMTMGPIKWRCPSKILTKDKHLIAISGRNCPSDRQLLDWFKPNLKKLPQLSGYDCSILVVPPRGHLQLWDENGGFEPLVTSFYSIGSGAEFAMGAMSAGASAREAVAIAIKWSPTCGGKITMTRRFQ